MLRSSYVVNDLHRINKSEILKKFNETSRFSLSFIFLLVGSSIVCTLGLLINSTAIVIGGMIISPLIWPLMHTAIGISYGRPSYIKKAILLLVIATITSILSAYLITLFSPIKIVNQEILARTNPTLMDLWIALVAGGIAALAMTQPRISESLAGVAIATSLMPPICVSGIGLALASLPIFTGGLLLFFSNVVAIIFISVLAFLWLGLTNKEEPKFQIRAVLVTATILIVTSIPLFFFMREYSFKTTAYSKAETVLINNFSEISPSAYVSNVKTTLQGNTSVLVEAEVLIPEGLKINYEERQKIQSDLQSVLNKDVELQLQLQNTISILSKTDIEESNRRAAVEKAVIEELQSLGDDITVDTVEIRYIAEKNVWAIHAVLRGDPTLVFSFSEQETIATNINEKINENVELDIEILSRIKIQSNPDLLTSKIRQSVRKYFEDVNSELVVSSIDIREQSLSEDTPLFYVVSVELKAPTNFVATNNLVVGLEDELLFTYETEFDVEISLLRYQVFSN